LLAVYRSPTANVNKFLEKLDNALFIIYNNNSEFIICGDVNINYLDSYNRGQLNALSNTYNIMGMVNFPT
jgi:protein involved in ribonucleotide reduction